MCRFWLESLSLVPYLASKVCQRLAATTIPELTLPDGSTASYPPAMLTEASRFFSDLFSALGACPLDPAFFTHDHPQLPQHLRAALCAPFSDDEILIAIKQLGTHKVPNHDGLPSELYEQHSKHFIPRVRELISKVFDSADPDPAFNLSLITLVYKNGDRSQISNYRPLSLLTTEYKILAKLIDNRLSPVMHFFIHSDQNGFLPRRRTSFTLSLNFLTSNIARSQMLILGLSLQILPKHMIVSFGHSSGVL